MESKSNLDNDIDAGVNVTNKKKRNKKKKKHQRNWGAEKNQSE